MGHDLSTRRRHIGAQAKPRCFPLLRIGSKAARRSHGRANRRGEANLDAEDRFERIENGETSATKFRG